MTSELTQKNKTIVWNFWQEMNNARAGNIANVIRKNLPEYIRWTGPHPINQLYGRDAIISDFWQPLLQAFPDLKHEITIFFGGKSNGRADGLFDGQEWVCGLGHLTGTFKHDWLTIPASGKPTQIRWSEFCRMHEGKIVELYMLLDIPDVMRQAGFPMLPPDQGSSEMWLAPKRNDGILLATQDDRETEKSMKLIRGMIYEGLNTFDESELGSMGLAKFFDPQLTWYGPSGIGTNHSLKEFEQNHQQHWLRAFPDRQVQDLDNLFTEGRFMGASGWTGVVATHTGQYLDCPATGHKISFNGIDIWSREGEAITENWVFVDLIDVYRQFGIDLFERMRLQIGKQTSPMSAPSLLEDCWIPIRSECDINLFASKVLQLAKDPSKRKAIEGRCYPFRLEQPGNGFAHSGSQPVKNPALPEITINTGLVDDWKITKLPRGTTVLKLGKRATISTLARDKARKMGITIEKVR